MTSDNDMPGCIGFIVTATITGIITFFLGWYIGETHGVKEERRKAVEANLAIYEFNLRTGESQFRYKMRDELCK
jgi:hypothetical protein